MIKKIVVLILVVVCLLPSVSFANDAIGFEDFDSMLSISYKLNVEEINLGEKINFTLTLTNNTNEPIGDIYISGLFSNANIANYYDKHLETDAFADLDIGPGERVTLDLTAQVLESLYWYIDKNEYYTVFQPVVEYTLFTKDEDYNDYYFQISKPTSIKIANLKNGSEFIHLESQEDQPWVFSEAREYYYDGYWFDDEKYMATYINSNYSIKNLSDIDIEDIYFRIDYFGSILCDELKAGELIEDQIESYAFIEKNIENDEIEIKTQALFKINDTYYGVQQIKQQTIDKKFFPNFETNITKDFIGDTYIFSIKNTTETDFNQFYFEIVYNRIIYDRESSYDLNNIYTFKKDYSFFTSIKDMRDIRFFVIGFVENDILYTWRTDYSYDTENNKTELTELFPLTYFNIQELIMPSPTPAPSPSPTSSPKPSKSPLPTPSPMLSPTPTPSPTAMPTAQPTASPAPAVTVNSITKKPAVPFWVWIALGCALLAAGLLSVLINIRRIKKEDEK